MSFPYIDQVLSAGAAPFEPSFSFDDATFDRAVRRNSRASRTSIRHAKQVYNQTWMWALGAGVVLAIVVVTVYIVRRRSRAQADADADAETQNNNNSAAAAASQHEDDLRARYNAQAQHAQAQARAQAQAQQTPVGQDQRHVRFNNDGQSQHQQHSQVGGMIGAMGVTGSGQWPAASRSAVPRVIGDFSHDAPVMLQNGEQQNRSPGVMLNTNIGGNERYDPPGENSGGGGGGGGRRGGGGDVSRPAQSTSSNGRAADLGGDPMSGFDYYGGSGGSGMGVGASPMQFVTLGNDTQRGLNASLGASLNDNDSENGGGGGGQNSQQQAAQSAAVREISDMSVWEKMTNHDKFKGVLMVYSDNCGHCVTTKPEFEAAARQLTSVVPFYRMNSQAAMPMLQRLGIQGVPWLAAFRGDSYSAYDGDRSANAIVQWARMSA